MTAPSTPSFLRSQFPCLCAALLLSASSTPLAHSQTASPATSDFHIGVIERNQPVRLSTQNVTVSAAGQSVAVAISAGATRLPTHLLVFLDATPNNVAPYNKTLGDLTRVFNRGWLVSVVRPDGYETPYVPSEAALAAALSTAAPATFDYASAFNQLAGFAGRRALIVEQGVSATNPAMLASARSLIPEVYRVDGGLGAGRSSGQADADWDYYAGFTTGAAGRAGNPPPPPAAYGQSLPPQGTRGRTANGVMHELKFAAAVKDALNDADHYYDLDVKSPVPGLAGPIQITYRHLHAHTVVLSETLYFTTATSAEGSTREPLRLPYSVRRQ